jgi:FkbM family methyltransferase
MKSSLIFDIGCHIGQDSDFYLQKGFKVVAVEANPALCAELKDRFSTNISDGSFTLIEKAIAENSGEVEFYVNSRDSIWGTIRSNWAERNASWGAESNKTIVPAVQFSSLIEQFGVPYYLKIDIEGADLLCLEGLLPFSERPQFVSLEIEDRSFLLEETRLLRLLGYTKFQIIEQSLVPKQAIPYPAREGRYVNYRFQHGASGLFGKELPGVWLGQGAFMFQYYRILFRNRLLEIAKRMHVENLLEKLNSATWYDLHATLK